MTKRRRKKLCAFGCGELAHKGRRLCVGHLEQQRVKMAEYRASRKEKGLCSRCPNQARIMPDGRPSTLCQTCREYVRDSERVARHSQKSDSV